MRLERYILRTLSWGDSLEVAEHLEACTDCSERLLVLRATLVAPSAGSRD